MGTIVISENVSLDGVIQDPAGDEAFTQTSVRLRRCPSGSSEEIDAGAKPTRREAQTLASL